MRHNHTPITSAEEDDDGMVVACHHAITKWYQLKTQWIRGLTDHKSLLDEWTGLIDDENADGRSSTSTFLYIDSAGNVWKGLNFVTDPLQGIDHGDKDNKNDSKTFETALCYGIGATWNCMETSVQEWHVHPIHHHGTNEDNYYKLACLVVETIEKGANDTSITLQKRVSGIIRCRDNGNEGEPSSLKATIVQLHESLIKDDDSDPTKHDHLSSSSVDLVRRRLAVKTNSASQHRYIAPPHTLDQYGAKPLLVETVASVPFSSTDDASTCGSSKEFVDHSDLVGLSIQGWNIATSQGPIADQQWLEQATSNLELLAQYKGGGQRSKEENFEKGRKLVLPEMVFPLAHVVLELNSTSNNDDDDSEGQFHRNDDRVDDVFVLWDATDALKEWSQAHQDIPMPAAESVASSSSLAEVTETTIQSALKVSFRGVGVLESFDAALWKQKQRSEVEKMENGPDKAPPHIRNTQYHYDWTYSTPYVGSIFVSGQSIQLSQSHSWERLSQSGMPMYLLTDTSIPILYYDHIVLYEDDLHDNGAVEYSVKVRIMPHCAYILARLFVRVDHVLVRLREARWLVEFPTSLQVIPQGLTLSDRKHGTTKIYRDVTWREAAWKDLGSKLGLPTQVQAWTTTSATKETPAFQALLSKLPLSDLPDGIFAHAELSY